MPQPLIISIPHTLGQDEAVRRVKSGVETVKTSLAKVMMVQEEHWEGNRLTFRVLAMGQSASGTVEVAQDHARLEVELPWLLARAVEQIQRAIQSRGRAILEKK